MPSKKRTFFEIKNISDDVGEIRVYGDICKWAWEEYGETSSVTFSKQLANLKNVKKLELKINSPGGDVFEAVAMYHEIKRFAQGKEVTAYIDGMAASAATILTLAANKTIMGKGCYFMIHNPLMYMGYANVEEMNEAIEHLNKTKDNLLDLYEEKCKLSRDEIAEKMDKTTWYTAEEALQAGFIDEIANYDSSISNLNISNVFTPELKNLAIPEKLKDILQENKEEKMTLQELKVQHPELLKAYEKEVIDKIKGTDTVKNAINAAIEEERKRIKALDNIKVTSEAAREIVDKAKFDEVRDYRDVIVDLYNLNAEKAGREIAQTEEEKRDAGIYDIQSGTLGNSKEQMENDIVNAALRELGVQ